MWNMYQNMWIMYHVRNNDPNGRRCHSVWAQCPLRRTCRRSGERIAASRALAIRRRARLASPTDRSGEDDVPVASLTSICGSGQRARRNRASADLGGAPRVLSSKRCPAYWIWKLHINFISSISSFYKLHIFVFKLHIFVFQTSDLLFQKLHIFVYNLVLKTSYLKSLSSFLRSLSSFLRFENFI